MIQNIIQFNGFSNEDPNWHFANFLEFGDMFKQIGVTYDAIYLRLFPFFLKYKAKMWLNSLAPVTITT